MNRTANTTFTADEIAAIKFCAEECGISEAQLLTAIKRSILYNEQQRREELSTIKNIVELSKEELWELRRQIVLNSLYISDYENTFGIEPRILSGIFDGYIEELYYIANPDEVEDFDPPIDEIVEQYDTAENLYNYVQYTVEWDADYLEEMTAAAKAEINEKYGNYRERLFEAEEIYYIAAALQYKAVA